MTVVSEFRPILSRHLNAERCLDILFQREKSSEQTWRQSLPETHETEDILCSSHFRFESDWLASERKIRVDEAPPDTTPPSCSYAVRAVDFDRVRNIKSGGNIDYLCI